MRIRYLSRVSPKKIRGKTCLLRVDLNLSSGEEKYSPRIDAILPSIRFLLKQKCSVFLASHRGRPDFPFSFKQVAAPQFSLSRFPKFHPYSLKPFRNVLAKKLRREVVFVPNYEPCFLMDRATRKKQSVFLLENVLLLPGEKTNSARAARILASFVDFFVNDAFAKSHRKVASLSAITEFLPAYGGFGLEREITNLDKVLRKPRRPLTVILGGAKLKDKLGVMKHFFRRADWFLLGGGVLNTFLAAGGVPMGNSVYDRNLMPFARRALRMYGKKIISPVDLKIKKKKILDIGPGTSAAYSRIIQKSGTIIWGGPMGYFEERVFASGSYAIARAVADSPAFSVLGGGETSFVFQSYIRNYRKLAQEGKIFISTGGGAMLAYLAGERMPGLEALRNNH